MTSLRFKRALSLVIAGAVVIGGVSCTSAANNVPATTGVSSTASVASSAGTQGEFPAKYDLREKGVVTPVKLQNPWGSCWAFSGIAASETSILSMLGTTNEEFKKTHNGENFDLSEKHLTWYGMRAITDKTNPKQAGEGLYCKDTEGNPNFVYTHGGFNIHTSSLFANGVGPVYESWFPYQGKEGLTIFQYAEKYPDKGIEVALAEFQNSVFAEPFEDAYQHMHNYPTGDEAIDKRVELWTGAFKKKGYLPEDQDLKAVTKDKLKDICYQYYLTALKTGDGNSAYSALDDWTIPELNSEGYVNRDVYSGFTLRDGNSLPEFSIKEDNKWKDVNWEGINAAKSELMKGHGISLGYKSDMSLPGQVETGKYINLDTWAHYTYEDIDSSHAVCIVGWDDDYPADNFNEGNRPPGNGAWIVKNSWGSETDWYDNGTGGTIGKKTWGIKDENGKHTGYFYLSYYDKSAVKPETFVFDDDLIKAGGTFNVLSHDYMPAYSSFMEDTGVQNTDLTKTANVFKNDGDKAMTLHSVSTKTASPKASVEYSVYKLKDKAANPEDGELMGKKTAAYDYKGFHRENMDEVIVIKPGETFSIVAKESVVKDGQTLYEFNVNAAPAKDSLKEDDDKYGVAVVNKGESFYYDEGKWIDWSAAIPLIKEAEPEAGAYVMDNFSIKAYLIEKE